MAHGYWPNYSQGSPDGPCVEACTHLDCDRKRNPAYTAPPCKECGKNMQAGEPYFREDDGQPLHARHAWDRESGIDPDYEAAMAGRN